MCVGVFDSVVCVCVCGECGVCVFVCVFEVCVVCVCVWCVCDVLCVRVVCLSFVVRVCAMYVCDVLNVCLSVCVRWVGFLGCVCLV